MNLFGLAGAGVIVAAIATSWSYVNMIWNAISGLVIVSVDVYGFQSDAVVALLQKRGRQPYRPHRVFELAYQVKNSSVVGSVFEVLTNLPHMILYKKRPIWIVPMKSESVAIDIIYGVNVNSCGDVRAMRVTAIRGTIDLQSLMTEAAKVFGGDMRDSDTHKRYNVRYITGTAGEALQMNAPGERNVLRMSSAGSMSPAILARRKLIGDVCQSSFGNSDSSSYVVTPSIKPILSDAMQWFRSREWYATRGICWKRGWVLAGQPGTGKTALVRYIAETLDLPVFVFDLASLRNKELRAGWREALSESPAIALIEDISAVFDGDVNITDQQGKLTHDALLNAIDGIEQADGIFTVITTNSIEKLHPALAGGRPGRIDRVYSICALTDADRQAVRDRVLCSERERAIAIPNYIEELETIASYREALEQLALKQFWASAETVIDYEFEVRAEQKLCPLKTTLS